MSKAARLALIRKNLATKTNNFEEADQYLAYAVFLIEREFHVGKIDYDFPYMKFINLWDETNLDRYKKMCEKGIPGGSGVKTFR